ncbi:MAG: restriction endonuclease, partial [Betaproteobacteria bacterium]
IVALLTPSGIAADKGAAEFFKGISVTGRLAALYDFETRNNPGGSFFPDVDSRFKFCTLVFGGKQRRFDAAACAFYLHAVEELAVDGRVLALRAQDFALVNPNTGAAPVFRNARDAGIVTAMYRRRAVLVDRSQTPPRKAWPVRYVRMFDMTNDSGLFLRRDELLAQDWQPAPPNGWRRSDEPGALALPLYEGKMVQMFDHRAADVVVNPANLKRPAQQQEIPSAQKVDPARYPRPQFWVEVSPEPSFVLGFKLITAPSNARTMIAALLPSAAAGNSLGLLFSEAGSAEAPRSQCLLVATLNCLALDFMLRQKVQGQNINWFIVEQLPVIAPVDFDAPLGNETIGDFVCREVLRLTYTAHDMA